MPESTKSPAEAGEPSLVDWFSQFIERHQEGCGSDTDALIACLDRVRDSYRAQPPAREDAQPVAGRMIGRDGSTISLQAEPYHGGFAHMMAADVGCTVQPLYSHPAPDALRELDELVSACEVEFCSPGTEGQSWTYGEDDDSEVAYPKSNITFGHIRRARQALAALQAEQKGGA